MSEPEGFNYSLRDQRTNLRSGRQQPSTQNLGTRLSRLYAKNAHGAPTAPERKSRFYAA